MKKIALLGLTAGLALATSGCAIAVRPAPYYPPVVVADPAGVVAIDYWYDGSVYYYYDAGLGLYFWYDAFGVRQWCGHGWAPHGEWLRHDGGYARDGGWARGRGHEGGRFPGEGRGGRGPGGGWHDGHGGRH